MSQPTSNEQYMLELINAARIKGGIQPLANNAKLNDAADTQANWMISTNTLSHTGAGGSSPYDRMVDAGFVFSGSWSWGENYAWETLRGAAGYADEVKDLHNWLMNSPSHLANIMNAGFTQVGVGFAVGTLKGWPSALVVEDFAKTSQHFLTGVVYKDLDGDKAYDPGEGLSGVTITAVGSAGDKHVMQTYGSGGYDMALSAGTYSVTIAGSGVTTLTKQVTVGSLNVKLDLAAPATTSTTTAAAPPASGSITGASGADVLNGTTGADSISGGNGADTFHGGAGADTLAGGAGNDHFVFDTAPASGADKITDFTPGQDVIDLSRWAFTMIRWSGPIDETQFWQGTAAHDSSDRIIYNKATGDLIYDPDGWGATAGTVFAHLTPGLTLHNTDFVMVG